MNKKDIKRVKLPDAPGIYIFRDSKRPTARGARAGKILYVGKATSLKSRVKSYFNTGIDKSRGPIIVKMLEDAKTVEWEVTDSVLEALILEANLIKKHQPTANSRDKDNTSFNYLIVTKEEFPRVLVIRGRELFSSPATQSSSRTTKMYGMEPKYIFGPFPQGGALKEGLKVVRKIFPFRDKCEPKVSKPCFNKQIGLCPGVCTGEVSKNEYGKIISSIKLLFEGKKSSLLKKLRREMEELAKAEKFEKANDIKRQIFALTHIRETALLGSEYKVSSGGGSGRLEAYDVAHISETARVGVMTVVEDGIAKKAGYRKFNIKTEKQGDIAALEEILRRRFEHNEWASPNLLVIDGGVAQKNAALRVLAEFGYQIPVVNVVKNERHKAGKLVGNTALIEKWQREILLANDEAHRFAIIFHRQKRRKSLI